MAEEGLQVHLIGKYGPECTTGQLDNSDLHDYGSMNVAMFNSTILGGTDDHGLGGCNNVRILYDLNIFTNLKPQLKFLIMSSFLSKI